MNRLYLDLETRWNIDLFKVGAVRAAADESAGINCIAWAMNASSLALVPYEDCVRGSQLNGLKGWFLDESCVFIAHNAQFEMECLERILGIKLPANRWIDTMAKCGYYGYPRSLKAAAEALGCDSKDSGGTAVMKKLVTGRYTPNDSPDDFNRLYSYCANDVMVMRQIDKLLPDLPPEIQARWVVDTEINARGVPVDVKAIENALMLKDYLSTGNDRHMSELTDGFVKTVGQTDKLVKWLQSTQGTYLSDCKAETVDKALSYTPMPLVAEQALELRQEAGLSSLAKYEAMSRYQVDGRLYEMHNWYGAHTGRPTGSGPQVLNLPRSQNPELWAETLSENPAYFYHLTNPSERLKEALRGTLCAPPGKTFVGTDLAQIEARATGWLAGEQKFLDLFATTDPYCTYGKKIFGREITKKDAIERTASKATVLAFGFAGGIGAGQRVAENYKIDFAAMADIILPTALPVENLAAARAYTYYMDGTPLKPLHEREAKAVDILKQRYRRDFPLIVQYWDILEQAFLYGGDAGFINVSIQRSGLRILTLPSGRQLFYHGVEIDDKGKYSYIGRKGRQAMWKGVVIENAAQAVNADVSDYFKMRANYEIAPVVHHCYDEFTMECDENKAEEVMKQLKELTQTKPPRYESLPLGFDYWTGRRYGK